LNADHEHADRYRDEDAVVSAYRDVLGQVVGPVVGVDREEGAAMQAADGIRAKVAFGWGKSGADYLGIWKGENAEGLKFGVQKKGEELGEFQVAATGRHNAGNALGALAVAQELGLPVMVQELIWLQQLPSRRAITRLHWHFNFSFIHAMVEILRPIRIVRMRLGMDFPLKR